MAHAKINQTLERCVRIDDNGMLSVSHTQQHNSTANIIHRDDDSPAFPV
jgi:hypothetical protein